MKCALEGIVMNHPLVSVIVPVYNMELYLDELFQSLVEQSMQDFRVIVIDDGSSDKSNLIIKDWVSNDPRFMLITQANQGLSASRNNALDYLAKLPDVTPYILFVDADDKLDRYALEHLYTKAKQGNLDILVFSGAVFYTPDNLSVDFPHYQTYYNRNAEYNSVYSGLDYLVLAQEADDFRPSACMQFFSYEFLVNSNIRFLRGIVHEDNLFTLNCLLVAKRVAYLNEKLYLRRIREDSIMTRKTSWKNVDGYFRCGVESLNLVHGMEAILSEKQADAIAMLIDAFFKNAFVIYKQISENDRLILLKEYSSSKAVIDQVLFTSILHQPTLENAVVMQRITDDYESSTSYKLGRMITKPARYLLRHDKD